MFLLLLIPVFVFFTTTIADLRRTPTFCDTRRPLLIISDSINFQRSVGYVIAVWGDAACVTESTVQTDNAIIIKNVEGTVDHIDVKPYSYLYIVSKPSTRVNVTAALAQLFDVPVVLSLDEQRELLQQSAFKYSPTIPTVWLPAAFNNKQYVLIKNNVQLTLSAHVCNNAKIGSVQLPGILSRWGTTAISNNSKQTVVLRKFTNELAILTDTNRNFSLNEMKFKALGVAFWHDNTLILLDEYHSVYIAGIHNVFDASFLHLFHTVTPKALFSTTHRDVFLISDYGILRLDINSWVSHTRYNSTIIPVPTHEHACLLQYFSILDNVATTPPLYVQPYNTVLSGSIIDKEHITSLLRIMETVHPEFLFGSICVILAISTCLFAILLCILIVTAKLAKKLRAFAL